MPAYSVILVVATQDWLKRNIILRSKRKLIFIYIYVVACYFSTPRLIDSNDASLASTYSCNTLHSLAILAFTVYTKDDILLPSNILYVAWIANLFPASCSEHSCKHGAPLTTFFLTTCNTTFPAILHKTSQIGLKPLSYGISLHTKNASSDVLLASVFI